MRHFPLVFMIAVACSGGDSDGQESDADTDADKDTDTDSDADTDSDTDTDPIGQEGVAPLLGDSVTFLGTLEDSDLTWNRPGSTCGAIGASQGNRADVIGLSNPSSAELGLRINATGSNNFFGTLHAYEGAPAHFSPATAICLSGWDFNINNPVDWWVDYVSIPAGGELTVILSNDPGEYGDWVVDVVGVALQESCYDGIDNDGDNLVDCDDTDDCTLIECTELILCDDGIDNDSDGLIDCADPDCDPHPAC